MVEWLMDKILLLPLNLHSSSSQSMEIPEIFIPLCILLPSSSYLYNKVLNEILGMMPYNIKCLSIRTDMTHFDFILSVSFHCILQ